MGGGIAAQIAYTYPNVEYKYIEYAPKALGEVCFAKADKYIVANCFSQDIDFVTDYNALGKCMRAVKEYMQQKGYSKVAIPFHYGCGIACGEWDEVESIIVSELKDMTIKIYHLDK